MTLVNLQRTLVVDGRSGACWSRPSRCRRCPSSSPALETELGQNAFVLYDRDYVLAHTHARARLPRPRAGTAAAAGDRDRRSGAVRDLGRGLAGPSAAAAACRGTGTGSATRATCTCTRPGAAASTRAGWSAAISRPRRSTSSSSGCCWRRVWGSLGLVAAALVAVRLGRRVSRPIVQLAETANAIRTLDLDDLAPLPPLAAARDRPGRDRVQCHGARAARVRRVYVPQTARAEPDQPRRSRPRSRPSTAR